MLLSGNQNRTIRSSMGDCHSFDPGSKFGLENREKKDNQPNGHPGPGAAHTSFRISNSNLEKLQQKVGSRDIPPYQTFKVTIVVLVLLNYPAGRIVEES